MTTPMITWSCITAAVILYFMVKLFLAVHHSRQLRAQHAHHSHRHHFFEMGTEREELFVGGDPLHEDDDCDEDEPEL